MRTTAALLLLLAAAGCSTPPPEAHASVTLYGSELRLESWKAFVVERGHFHTKFADNPCPMALMYQASDFLKALGEDRGPLLASLNASAGDLCAKMIGPAYGGPDRLVLALCRFGKDQEQPEELLVFDFPRLNPGQIERRFEAGAFLAGWERPATPPAAKLERGWVRVRRLNPGDGLVPGRYDFEIFAVLSRSDGPVQVVTRVQAPAQ